MGLLIPRIYPILDSAFVPVTGREAFLKQLGHALADAGVMLLEYRNKTASDADVFNDAVVLRQAMPPGQVRLVLDDRVDVAMAAGFDGVHVDAGDLPPAMARRLLGPDKIVGTFGGSVRLEPEVLKMPVDYLAIGPVFATTTKETSRRPIGIDGVRSLRAEAGSAVTLVAAAGITLETAAAVLSAGADSVAVAAGIFLSNDPAAEFRRWASELANRA